LLKEVGNKESLTESLVCAINVTFDSTTPKSLPLFAFHFLYH